MDQQTFSSTLPPPKANLFTLPLEIRNEIYRHLLSTRLTRVDLGLGHARYDIQPAILATKRQIHDEGTAILSENKFISIITSWTSFKQDLLVQGKFPTIAERQSDDNVLLPVPHMFTALNSSAVDYDPKVCYEYLTCLDDLPYLCRLLFYTSCQIVDFNRSLHLTLAIQHPPGRSDEAVSKKLQEDLMMPFAVLKGLGSLTVTGAKNNAVEKELRKAMKTPNPTAGEYLESAAKLKDAGDVAFKAGDYTGSIKIYIQAYEAMIFIVEGKRFAVMLDYYFASKILIEGRFSGQRGDLVRHHLGSQLSWNILQAYVKMEDWEQAYF